jgi:serine/threonine protein kinase
MKNVKELEASLDSNHFHPLNFFVPMNIRPIKPYEVMLDGTLVSVYSFYSESQEKELFLKISTSEKRQYNENLTYMMDSLPGCMLKKYNSFSFAEKNGKSYFYSVFQMIDCTLDDFISERLENSNFDEICTSKNTVNPSYTNFSQGVGAWPLKLHTPDPSPFHKEEEFIREDEIIYLWRDIIYAFADLQKARICHRDIRPDNIAMVPIEDGEGFDNRKTDYTTYHDNKSSNFAK